MQYPSPLDARQKNSGMTWPFLTPLPYYQKRIIPAIFWRKSHPLMFIGRKIRAWRVDGQGSLLGTNFTICKKPLDILLQM